MRIMNTWIISKPKQIGKSNTTENLEQIDQVKVKVTRCFITKNDIDAFTGAVKNVYPYVPSDIAVGQVVETTSVSDYLQKGAKVYLAPLQNTTFDNGFLRDFAVIPESHAHALPQTVNEADALYLFHLSLALTVIDKLKIDKGQHVAILGGTILANVIAQLVMYYQAVPIIIDCSKENLDIAHKTDIYYTLLNDKNLEDEILSITGGRKCSKVIYVTDSDINIDVIDKISANGAFVGVTGIAGTKTKLTCNLAFKKELNVQFIKNGMDNVKTGINLLAQKAINLSYFKLPTYKFEYVNKHFENASTKIENGEPVSEFIVDLL